MAAVGERDRGTAMARAKNGEDWEGKKEGRAPGFIGRQCRFGNRPWAVKARRRRSCSGRRRWSGTSARQHPGHEGGMQPPRRTARVAPAKGLRLINGAHGKSPRRVLLRCHRRWPDHPRWPPPHPARRRSVAAVAPASWARRRARLPAGCRRCARSPASPACR